MEHRQIVWLKQDSLQYTIYFQVKDRIWVFREQEDTGRACALDCYKILYKHCAVDNNWFSDELLFTSFSPENMFLPPSKPLDLSPYSSTGDQSQLTDFFLHPGLDPVTRRTPSPVLEASQSLYKVSVNSTLLGDALSRIQSSMSMSNSLVNLSSVSDVLPVNLSSLSDVLQDNDKWEFFSHHLCS